jgi:hypothetical protein
MSELRTNEQTRPPKKSIEGDANAYLTTDP